MKEDTRIVTLGRDPVHNHGIINPPVYHASTVLFPTVQALEQRKSQPGKRVSYGISGTPTQFALENAIAALEGGHDACLFPSGLAAVAFAILAYVKAGDHILVVDAVYGPTRQFCDESLRRFGVETTYYRPGIGAGIASLMKPNTRLVFVESPGSVTMEIQDIPAIAAVAKPLGVTIVMDNTWGSPLFFKPFTKGVDVSIQAVTKYIAGHSDVMMGSVTATPDAWPALKKTAAIWGQNAAPDDCFLALRGLRTIAVRMRHQQAAALRVARWLQTRPEVARVLYPALPEDPGHTVWKRDFTGAAGVFSAVLNPCSAAALAAMLEGMQLFGMGFSWGGYESLMVPGSATMQRTVDPWKGPGPLVRLQIGLEDPEDLIADLEAGLERLGKAK